MGANATKMVIVGRAHAFKLVKPVCVGGGRDSCPIELVKLIELIKLVKLVKPDRVRGRAGIPARLN